MSFIPMATQTFVLGEGDKDAKIAIIGEAPGAYEEREGRPFVGPAGGILESCLHTAGLTRAEMYITNLVKVKPAKNLITPWFDAKKGLTPLGKECQAALVEELNEVGANVLVTLGAASTYALTGVLGILKWRGSILPTIENLFPEQRKVVACIHPAATLHGGKKIKSAIRGETSISPYIYRYYISQDLKRAKEQSDFPEIRYKKRALIVEMTFDEALQWIKFYTSEGLDWGKPVAVDIEVVNYEVSCISLCADPELSISIPFYCMESAQAWTLLEECILWKAMAGFLENEKITKVFQNGIFDRHFLAYRNNIITRGDCEDTMYAHHIIFPDFHKGLQFLNSVYCDMPYYKDEGKHWSKWKGDELGFRRYNAKDTIATLETWNSIKDIIEKEGYTDSYEFTKRLIDPLIYMMLKGIRVGRDELARTKIRVFDQIVEKEKELDTLVGRHLNALSPKQIQTYFYVELGLEPYYKTQKTATGIKKTVTTDDKAMQRFAKGTAKRKPMKAAKLIQGIRGLTKLYGTYLNIGFDEDNRFRFSVNPRGTTTGRLSTSKTIFETGTNVQNLPTQFKTFLLADPGYCLVEIDKRQAEWVCVAYMSGDAYMMQIIEEGKDPHTATAHLMTNIPEEIIIKDSDLISHESDPDAIAKLREDTIIDLSVGTFLPRNMSVRQMGKKANHGLNYDEGIVTFAEMNRSEERRVGKECRSRWSPYH